MLGRPANFVLCWLALTLSATPLAAQKIVRPGQGDAFHLITADLAVLSADEKRNDLPCSVEPLEPKLEYDLNFQAGYLATLPLKAVAGSGNVLRILLRVTPLDGGDPIYFRERFEVPSVAEDAEGDATLPGKYLLGPGKYRVDWLMRDRAERVCASNWEVLAETVEGFEKLASTPRQSLIAEVDEEPFFEEPPVRRAAGELLHVKLLLNFTPLGPSQARLSGYDLRSITSMLRAIAREPKIGWFTVAAYHMHEERVFFEEARAPRIDFQALGEAYEDVQAGMIDFAKLQDKESGKRFLADLVERFVAEEKDPADAIVFLGPKLVFERNPGQPILSGGKRPSAQLAYLIYNRNPRSYPWKDAISSGLRNLDVLEFDVTSPKDFGQALQRLLARIRGQAAPDPAERTTGNLGENDETTRMDRGRRSARADGLLRLQ